MKELVVVSGKGGTGKTSLVASFASLHKGAVLADCDVDASNLHLLLKPEIHFRSEFRAGHAARIREAECMGCGLCREYCRFDAVMSKEGNPPNGAFFIDPIACEGCGVCAEFCPEGAIDLLEQTSGVWFVSHTRHGPMVHARLGIAAENSGKLVTQIRITAKRLAEEKDLGLVIVDGSPGIGCPVIASITGCDLVLAVTEPTRSGLHDLKRIADLAGHFSLPVAVIVNKSDLNESMTTEIFRFCEKRGFLVVGKIPYSQDFTDAMVACQSIVEYKNGPASEAVRAIWKEIQVRLNPN
jgi:MinD superfamily P-loop ATPase